MILSFTVEVYLQQQKLCLAYSLQGLDFENVAVSTIVEIMFGLQPTGEIPAEANAIYNSRNYVWLIAPSRRVQQGCHRSTIVEIMFGLQPQAMQTFRASYLQQQKLCLAYSREIMAKVVPLNLQQQKLCLAYSPIWVEYPQPYLQQQKLCLAYSLQRIAIKQCRSTIVEIMFGLQPLLYVGENFYYLQQQKLCLAYSRCTDLQEAVRSTIVEIMFGLQPTFCGALFCLIYNSRNYVWLIAYFHLSALWVLSTIVEIMFGLQPFGRYAMHDVLSTIVEIMFGLQPMKAQISPRISTIVEIMFGLQPCWLTSPMCCIYNSRNYVWLIALWVIGRFM